MKIYIAGLRKYPAYAFKDYLFGTELTHLEVDWQ